MHNKTDQAFLCIENQVFELIQEVDGTLTTHLLLPYFDLSSEHIDIIYHDRQNEKVFLASSTNGLFEVKLPLNGSIVVTRAKSAKLHSDDFSLLPSNSLALLKSQMMQTYGGNEDIILDQLTVDGEKLPIQGDTIRLFSKSENVKFYFSTAYFGNPENLKISYSLAESGQRTRTAKWLDVDSNDDLVISYSSLSAGTFTFTIRKQVGYGPNDFVSKHFTIIVPERWYENVWALLFFGSVLPLLGFGILRYRFRKIEARNRLLEMQVSVRTEELRQTLITLETSQGDLIKQFQMQSRLLTSLAHDLRSPLSAAILVTGEVGRLIKKEGLDQAGALNKQVEDAVVLIKQSLDELLTYIKVQVYSKEVKIGKVALANLVDKTFEVYSRAARINSNNFKNNVPTDVTGLTNPQLLDIILRNLTDNANKFTENGTISTYWTQDKASGALTIQDTGRGLPASLIKWFKDVGSTSIPEKFSGLGLVIVRELAPFAMIRLDMESEKGRTLVTLHFSNHETHEVGDI